MSRRRFPYSQIPHEYAGSSPARQTVGNPGHCEDCCSVGHVDAHPDLGCGDVGCVRDHPEAEQTPDDLPTLDLERIERLIEKKQSEFRASLTMWQPGTCSPGLSYSGWLVNRLSLPEPPARVSVTKPPGSMAVWLDDLAGAAVESTDLVESANVTRYAGPAPYVGEPFMYFWHGVVFPSGRYAVGRPLVWRS